MEDKYPLLEVVACVILIVPAVFKIGALKVNALCLLLNVFQSVALKDPTVVEEDRAKDKVLLERDKPFAGLPTDNAAPGPATTIQEVPLYSYT